MNKNVFSSNFMKKTLISALILMAVLAFSVPIQAKAFCPEDLVDPFGLWHDCENNNSNNNTAPVNTNTETPLSVSCYSVESTIYSGDSAVWKSYVSGGNGSYTFSWSGTDGLVGYSQNVSKAYGVTGQKSASIRVTSGSQVKTAVCSNNISVLAVQDNNNQNNDNNGDLSYYSNLTGRCNPVLYNYNIGDQAFWSAYATGGTGVYSYTWTGTDGLSGSGPSVYKIYNDSGIKTASVVIKSGNQTINVQCSSSLQVLDNGNYNNNNNNNNYGSLSGSCYPDRTSVNIGDSVVWRSYVTGGNGNYTYRWSGTEGLNDTGSSAYISYNYSGTKNATVRIYSGSNSTSISCDNSVRVYDDYYNNNNYNNNYDYGNLSVSCRANKTSASVGESVTWSVSANGGNGYYTYSWTGTDNIYGSGNTISAFYNSLGQKTASVTVSSGYRTITQSCNNSVNIVNPYQYSTANYYPSQNLIEYSPSTNTLGGACFPNKSVVRAGETVIWNASVTGGQAPYSIVWSGTNGLSGYGSSVSKSYSGIGTYSGTISVNSADGKSGTFNCGGSVKVTGSTSSTVSKNSNKGDDSSNQSNNSNSNNLANSLFSLSNIPWGWVALLIILVLFMTVVYLVLNKNKI